jgi:hypothetical protein
MSTILKTFSFRMNLDAKKEHTQLPVRLNKVLTIARCWVLPVPKAELKLGQNIHRKIVPIIAKRSDLLTVAISEVGK